MHTQDPKMQDGITNAINCHKVCLETMNHCLTMGGEHVAKDHFLLMMDCAKICETAVDYMSRGSAYHAEVCGVCANVCEACARSCEKLDGEEMKSCATTCRICAESCRAMAQ